MGSACCVAARDRTITNGSSRTRIPRTIRYSPAWSVRRDNRRRVAGEEASMNWVSDDYGTNDMLEDKFQTVGTAYALEEGSRRPLETMRNQTWQKSSFAQSDQSYSQITSEVKGSNETQLALEPSPMMMSSSTSSDIRIPAIKSPTVSISEDVGSSFMLSRCSNESTRGSHVGSSDGWSVPTDGWSVPTFNELVAASNRHKQQWSFDSSRVSGRVSSSPSIDTQTCGVCSMLLTERGTQKYIATTNEIAVVAILICGHVYHSECLESMTSETNKYDPLCPVCTFGEKKVIKMSEKALKADLELKCRNKKKSRGQVVDGDDDIMFDHHHKVSRKMSLSSSMKSSLGKQFLKRHFSFGSKGSRSFSDDNFPRKKGICWAKSSRE